MKLTQIALAGTITALAGAATAQEYTARLPLDVPENNPKYAAAEIFAEAVSEKTDGAVEIQLFGNSLLGGEVYVCVKNCRVRATEEIDSEEVGSLTRGNEVVALERGREGQMASTSTAVNARDGTARNLWWRQKH